MNWAKRKNSRRLSLLMAVGALVTGGVGASALLAAPAQATACGTAQATCTMTGTLTLTAGTLNLTTSTSLSWTGAVTGADLKLVDLTAADETYTVVDATGSGAGWHVTTSATTFTTGPLSLANTGTFSTNGSLVSSTATGYPTTACTASSTCTVPTHTTAPTTYPVLITTATSAPPTSVIYDANAATGIGSIAIGGSGNPAPVGWWLNVPGNTKPGSYVSSISMAVITAP
jgi:hypothetical protein